jgi:ATP-binding cassette subfamily B protein
MTPAKTPTNTRLTPAVLPGRRGRISTEKPKNVKRVISRLWYYLKQQKPMLIWMLVLLVINTCATLGGSYLLRPIINNILFHTTYQAWFA